MYLAWIMRFDPLTVLDFVLDQVLVGKVIVVLVFISSSLPKIHIRNHVDVLHVAPQIVPCTAR